MRNIQLAPDFELPIDVALEASAILGTKGAGKSSTIAVIVEELHAATVQFCILDPTGVFWGLRSSADGKEEGLPIIVLGGAHGDAPLEPTAGALIADVLVDSGQSIVLDLSDFPSYAETARFALAFATRLYARKNRARSPLCLILDEAEQFVPQTAREKGDVIKMLGAFERIVGLGRSRGLGVILVSRRAQAINKNALDYCDTLLAMRIGAELAIKKIEGWIRDKEIRDELGVLDSLPGLPTGTAWVWRPVDGTLEKVAIRRIRTFDSYFTPKPGMVLEEPSVLAPIDLAALGAQIAATVERAKENDPAELRKRIAELEKAAASGDRNADLAELAAWASELGRLSGPDAIEEVLAVYMMAKAGPREQGPGYSCDLIDEVRALADRPAEKEIIRVPLLAPEDVERLDRAAESFRASAGLLVSAAGDLGEAAEEARAAAGAVAQPLVAAVTEAQAAQERALAAQIAGPAEPRPRPPAPRPATPPRPPAPRPAGHLPGPQLKILVALAWWRSIGNPLPSRAQVAYMAGCHPDTKSHRNALSALKTAGLIDYGPAGGLSLTAAGIAEAPASTIPLTQEALRGRIFERLPGVACRLLELVLAADPEPVERAWLAEQLGYHPDTKSFRNALGRLSKTFGLIEYPSPGFVSPTSTLFLR